MGAQQIHASYGSPPSFVPCAYQIGDKLPRLKLPGTLVLGEKDPIVPQRWFDEAGGLLGTHRVVVIPEWECAVQYGAAEQLVTAIRPFLVKADRAAAR